METWTILPTLAVRMTGFPIEMLEGLRFTRTTAVVREILACEGETAALRRILLDEQFAAAVTRARTTPREHDLLGALSGWRRAVGRGRAIEGLEGLPPGYHDLRMLLMRWNDVLAQHASLLAVGRATWQDELVERRRDLRALAADPRVQEAIFLSNPGMYAALQHYLGGPEDVPRTSVLRKFERRLVFYLQRFCAKNETQSFFGPINYGRFDLTQRENLRLRRASQALRRRVAFPSQWMAEALAGGISVDPELRPFLRPRRSPFCTMEANRRLCFPALGKTLSLEPTEARLYQWADGGRTVADLAALLQEDWCATWQRIERLQGQGALVASIIVPADLDDPLAYLRRWLEHVPDEVSGRGRWADVLDELRGYVAAFASADLPERVRLLEQVETRFTAVRGDAARRGAGTMYSDRLLLFEECLGDLEYCGLGGALARQVAACLQPILRLARVYGQLRKQRDQSQARALLDHCERTDGRGVPFLAYLQALRLRASEAPAPARDGLDAFLAALAALVQARSDGRRACLHGDDLPLPALSPEPDALYCGSLDMLIGAPDLEALQRGDAQIVLGEAHPHPLVWVFPTAYFLDERDGSLASELQAGLAAQPGAATAAQVVFTRKSKIFPYALPGSSIELRPRRPNGDAIPAAEVSVHDVDGQLLLRAGERHLRLYSPVTRAEHEPDPLAPFAFPAVELPLIDLGAHTPRIEIDGVVYQRERWVLPGGPLGGAQARDFDLFLDLWRWKERHGLPDQMFVRAPQEPKPLYVDLSCYFLAEVLDQLAGQSERLTVTEMLPTTQQLWLSGQIGRHCCEFRAVVVAQPDGSTGEELA